MEAIGLRAAHIPGGEERTREEYERLFAAGGFRLTRVVDTRADVSVIEGEKTG